MINRYSDPERTNLGTQFARISLMAGLGKIQRPFDNMRASRSTEVYADFGAFLESQWIGHSSKIAMAHYLQVRESDYARAAGKSSTIMCGSDNSPNCDERSSSHVDTNCKKVANDKNTLHHFSKTLHDSLQHPSANGSNVQ
ncbi:MAG: hypothetical protein ACRC2T_17180 [Thermoguttaceae bacterium]